MILPSRLSTERESQLADIAQPLFNLALRSYLISGRSLAQRGRLPNRLEELVESGVTDVSRRPMILRYVQDIHDALAEAHRVLKPGGQAIYVLGPSILSRREYDAPKVFKTIAREVGFRPLDHARRDIDQSRRSLPPPRRSARNQHINRRMTCEFYVALRKDDE